MGVDFFPFDWWIAFDYPLSLEDHIYTYNGYVNPLRENEQKTKEIYVNGMYWWCF